MGVLIEENMFIGGRSEARPYHLALHNRVGGYSLMLAVNVPGGIQVREYTARDIYEGATKRWGYDRVVGNLSERRQLEGRSQQGFSSTVACSVSPELNMPESVCTGASIEKESRVGHNEVGDGATEWGDHHDAMRNILGSMYLLSAMDRHSYAHPTAMNVAVARLQTGVIGAESGTNLRLPKSVDKFPGARAWQDAERQSSTVLPCLEGKLKWELLVRRGARRY
ncbi:hypothetical protein FA13DRAFT_1715879 [Coprinellus micaceus]|uniref:Uncharacterized protein n=1 Tax=Coprinellus micaceus TaxID=71717 RepID=A0A4Y7SL97_COPMI|nr:hypothetical protein FA13DRAFT_1715879 [Coprinellus micaceus]